MSKRKKVEGAAASGSIALESRLSIVDAVALHRTLAARLAAGGALVIDGSRVEEIDTAILQLLASLWRSARERGVGCAWLKPTQRLCSSAALIGLAAALDLPEGRPPDTA